MFKLIVRNRTLWPFNSVLTNGRCLIELLVIHSNTWNHLTLYKKNEFRFMLSTKCLFKLYIYIYIYEMPSIRFQTFLIQGFKIVVDSWKFSMLSLYILWGDWPIFMISALNEQLQQELEYTLLKPDCHSWWISKIQSGRETL